MCDGSSKVRYRYLRTSANLFHVRTGSRAHESNSPEALGVVEVAAVARNTVVDLHRAMSSPSTAHHKDAHVANARVRAVHGDVLVEALDRALRASEVLGVTRGAPRIFYDVSRAKDWRSAHAHRSSTRGLRAWSQPQATHPSHARRTFGTHVVVLVAVRNVEAVAVG
jgi:hypothetical protein